MLLSLVGSIMGKPQAKHSILLSESVEAVVQYVFWIIHPKNPIGKYEKIVKNKEVNYQKISAVLYSFFLSVENIENSPKKIM